MEQLMKEANIDDECEVRLIHFTVFSVVKPESNQVKRFEPSFDIVKRVNESKKHIQVARDLI